MNQRIQELLIQSEVFNNNRTVMKGVTGYELNKFAQLIVRECASLAYDGPGGILDHFGLVEE